MSIDLKTILVIFLTFKVFTTFVSLFDKIVYDRIKTKHSFILC